MILPVVRQLLALQERDQKIKAFQKDLKDMPRLQQHARSRLSDDEAELARTQGAARDIELKIKSVELDVQTRRTSIARLKEQQFNTRKNEEFQALSHEVTRYENEVRTLEDKELDLMGELEGAKPAVAVAQAGLKETKKVVDEELAALAERSAAVEARLAELIAERAQLAAEVDSTTMSLYDRLMKSKGDAAIAPLTGGICQGCHVRVVVGTVQKLKANESITQCEQCGRVLYEED